MIIHYSLILNEGFLNTFWISAIVLWSASEKASQSRRRPIRASHSRAHSSLPVSDAGSVTNTEHPRQNVRRWKTCTPCLLRNTPDTDPVRSAVTSLLNVTYSSDRWTGYKGCWLKRSRVILPVPYSRKHATILAALYVVSLK